MDRTDKSALQTSHRKDGSASVYTPAAYVSHRLHFCRIGRADLFRLTISVLLVLSENSRDNDVAFRQKKGLMMT